MKYGYIIKNIELNDFNMHVFNRLNDIHGDGKNCLAEQLNFETCITEELRKNALKIYFDNMIEELKSINTEKDIFNELKKRAHLNDIPLIVKKYFNLE